MKKGIRTKYRCIKPGFKLVKSPLYRAIASHEPASTENPVPLTWMRAKDFSVWDDRGNKWIDLTSGIFVANAGHANPKITRAIKRQLDQDLVFAYNYPTAVKERYITKLLSLSPKQFN